jgi:hypothetical protein
MERWRVTAVAPKGSYTVALVRWPVELARYRARARSMHKDADALVLEHERFGADGKTIDRTAIGKPQGIF